jgi:acetyl-CoA carboxylase biotin carboxyl carrier protein
MSDRPEPILAAVDLLAPAFADAGLDELELTVGEISVRLARPRPPVAPVAVPAAAPPPAADAAPAAPADGVTPFGQPAPGMRFVTAPLTGVWYPAPSPGARPYVNEGDEVAVGQVIGLIEAMKLFNEIKSDVSGRISRVLVENGTLVKRKQPLLEVDPR